MNKTKNLILLATLSIILQFLAMSAHAETKANCMIYGQTGKHGKTKIPVFSDHSFSISNPYPENKVYHIEFRNGIMYQNPYYSPNAKKILDLPVDSGKTYIYGPERINAPAYFSIVGTYNTQATTTISIDGKTIATCTNKNIITIF